jgi:hypothetical protein
MCKYLIQCHVCNSRTFFAETCASKTILLSSYSKKNLYIFTEVSYLYCAANLLKFYVLYIFELSPKLGRILKPIPAEHVLYSCMDFKRMILTRLRVSSRKGAPREKCVKCNYCRELWLINPVMLQYWTAWSATSPWPHFGWCGGAYGVCSRWIK